MTAPDAGTPDIAAEHAKLAEASKSPEDFWLVYRTLMAFYDSSCRVAHMTAFADEVAAVAVSALAATGRLARTDATVVIECEINWVDVRSARADAYGKAYAWPPETFNAWLAKEIEAAGQFHRAPVSMRKRTVSTFSDGSTLVGPWQPAPTTDTEDTPRSAATVLRSADPRSHIPTNQKERSR